LERLCADKRVSMWCDVGLLAAPGKFETKCSAYSALYGPLVGLPVNNSASNFAGAANTVGIEFALFIRASIQK
jgi:hypothetical protein